ncbi:CLUMA_CG000142, isoform A [Clunio marinus]|uniref:WD repeat-containing protein 55 homolog n=1 Tax=Clunio marinus TaxID=568069 RepID=A0A1J1HEZ7_9DIPT|nr:CLUMA_CG000142, isoform A [Clunio marinus]
MFRYDFYPPGRGNGFIDYSDDEDLDAAENLTELLADQTDLADFIGFGIVQENIVMGDTENTESSDDEFEPSQDVVENSDSDFLVDTSEDDQQMDLDTTIKSLESKGNEASSSGTSSKSVEKRIIDDYDSNDEEDEIVRKILKELKKPRLKPQNITIEDFPTDLSFHPVENILAVGTVMGDVMIYKYTNEENIILSSHEVHTKAIRDIEFSLDGRDIYSCSRDKSIMMTDFETGKLKRFWDKAHDEPIYTLTVLDENLIATGDDDGTVRLWDTRIRESSPTFSLKEVEDYISCIITNNQKKLLVCLSGDGYVTALNIGSKKMFVQSEPYEEELTCGGIFRNESKLVVGSSKGNFYTFNWGEFGYHNDAFSGPVTPISLMLPITERIAITAGEEGIIKAMHLVPGRVLGIVGQHSLAVETMDICNDGEFIATSSHDNDIRFWNIKYFEDFDAINYNEKPSKKASKYNLPSSLHANRSDFFADLA